MVFLQGELSRIPISILFLDGVGVIVVVNLEM